MDAKGRHFIRAASFIPVLILGLAFCRSAGPPPEDYSASLRFAGKSISSFEGETGEAAIVIENVGRRSWTPGGENPCRISYHLLDRRKEVLRYENPRTPLPREIRGGDKADAVITVKAPLEAGDYFLEFDLLREGIRWFKDGGSKTLLVPFKVVRREWPEDSVPLDLEDRPATQIESSVPEFNALMKMVRITLRRNEVSFGGKTGPVEGFSAGTGYPQIWIRDAATILPASKYFYPEPRLRSWLEEHLALQHPDGALEDWLDSRGMAGKNTAASDQETSAVLGACEVARILGPGWMTRKIEGVPVIDRLERALDFLLVHRFDAKRGLITRAHTADWGDVDMAYPDNRAVDADASTHMTAGIYDQAMFHQAAVSLARWFAASGLRQKALFWRERARTVKRNANERLWQEDRGFFRIHLHLDGFLHDFDEENIFAMGGNVRAILSGLAGSSGDLKPEKIIEQALARQAEFKESTVSAVLLPPYPKGFFKNPALDEPFEYQNGGQWDWFGGDLVLAMFRSGFSREARDRLIEIARKNIKNGGFFEWDTPEGQGRGSDYFSGSAGSLARALIEGYFGIGISESGLELSPRIGLDKARIRVHLPAASRFAAYDYETAGGRIRIDINSSFNTPSPVRILVPWAASAGTPFRQDDFEVRRNGAPIPFSLERKGKDETVAFETIPQNCRIEILYLRPIE